MNPVLGSLLGATSFAVAQIIWTLGHSYFGWNSPWVLEPGSGIVLCLSLLVATAGVASFCRRKGDAVIIPIIFVALGALAATIAGLLIVGPGNLWPLVLIVDAVMILVAVCVGAAVGDPLRKERMHAA